MKHVAQLRMSLKSIPQSQPSNVVYLSFEDIHANTREAMEVVSKLHEEYRIGIMSEDIVVVQVIKKHTAVSMRSTCVWYRPQLVGSFHWGLAPVIKFPLVLMKVYFDAGLKDLAVSSGFRGETLTSLR